MFLTIADASICQVFESHVSSLAQKEDAEVKETWSSHKTDVRWCL